jgi:Raf kinase inhibitor-like YbhB/YbcL family protein
VKYDVCLFEEFYSAILITRNLRLVMKRTLITAATFIVLMLISFCSGIFTNCKADIPDNILQNTITVTSDNFKDGEKIPVKYSCDGVNVSPQLAWTPGPGGTQFYVMLMDDMDAPKKPFSHWILYNIPASVNSLHEGISTNGILDTGAIQGRNDMTKLGYYGPCPGDGNIHHYIFTVYAVDEYFQMPAAWRDQVVKAMQGHVLAQGQLTGTYQR